MLQLKELISLFCAAQNVPLSEGRHVINTNAPQYIKRIGLFWPLGGRIDLVNPQQRCVAGEQDGSSTGVNI